MSDWIDNVLRIMTAVAACGAVIMSIINSFKIREVHVSINSRMDQLLEQKGLASRAEGAAEERAAKVELP
jgi:hypothetical protein